VAKPEDVFDFFKSKGFHLQTLKTCGGGLGCNEFVFVKTPLSLPGKTADPQQTEA
jgi:2-polyprenyl-6-hydroxyphenyl methylase/3-demethylubiquinone-9 3-methyltransferase